MNLRLSRLVRRAASVAAGKPSGAHSRPVWRRALAVVVMTGLILPSPLHTMAVHAQNLPNLGDESGAVLTPQMERKIGEGFYRDLRRDPSFLDDAEVTAYLQELGARLVAAGPEPALSVEFFAINDRQINAFAMLGGYIGVNSGLIIASESEAEAASVLGHEIGHLTHKHIARGFAAAQRSSVASLVGAALCLLAARSNPQVASGCVMASQAGAVQSQLAYSRDFEREADRIGFDILHKGGFDVAAMPVFFERLQRSTRILESNAPSYVRSHPLTTERIADVRNRVHSATFGSAAPAITAAAAGTTGAALPAAGAGTAAGVSTTTAATVRSSPLAFHLVRAKLRATMDESIDGTRDAIRHFTTLLDANRGASAAPLWFGLAYAQLLAKDAVAARAAFARIASPGLHPMYATLDARIRRAAGDAGGALTALRSALARHSASRALQLELIDSLQEAARHGEALALLSAQLQIYRSDPKLHQLQAKSYGAEGRRMLQHQAQAEYFILTGSLQSAIEQLQWARCTGEADFYQASILDARIRSMWQRMLDERADHPGGAQTQARTPGSAPPQRPGVEQGMPGRC